MKAPFPDFLLVPSIKTVPTAVVTHPLLASGKLEIVLHLPRIILPSPFRQGDVGSLCQVPFGWWDKTAFLKSVRFVWDLDSGDDPLRSVFSAFCITHGSLSYGLLKKGWAGSVAWQSLSAAEYKLRQGFLWGMEGANLEKASPDNSARLLQPRLAENSLGGINQDDL